MGRRARDHKAADARESVSNAGVAGRIRTLLLGTAAQFLTAPLIGMCAGFMLLFGGIFLALSWQIGVQPVLDSRHFAGFTGSTSGRIVESWVALDFDPQDMRETAVYWEPAAKVTACAVVEYGNDWGTPLRRAFCGNRFTFRNDFRLDDWNTLAPEVPFAFVRDASGFALEELRMSKTAMDWLKSHPPSSTFMLSKPPPTTAIGALQEQFDRPVDVATASWSRPFPEFPLAFEPQHADAAMPAGFVEERRNAFFFAGLIFAAIFAVPGLFVWRMGIGFLFDGQRPAVLWLVTIALLCALPWWNEFLPQFLRHVSKDWASVGSDMLDDINRTTRLTASAPSDALLAGGERVVWHLDQGKYADTFGLMRFTLPDPAPKSKDAAQDALRQQVRAQVGRLNPAAQAELFTRLQLKKVSGLDEVQSIFTTAAEDALRDANTDPAVRKAARQFLYTVGYAVYDVDAIEKNASK
jgi:hypothetical protein